MDPKEGGPSICIGEELLTLNAMPKGIASISLESLRRHLCILGTTGSGKSVCATIICHELHRLGVPTLILDRTGEYVASLGSLPEARTLRPGDNLVIALFKRRDEGPDFEAFPLDAQIEGWVSLLDHYNHTSYSEGLSPLQTRVLREVFDEYYHGTRQTLTISNLIGKLRKYEEDVSDFRGWPESIEATVSRLWPMVVSAMGEALDRSYETFEVASLFEPRLNIIDLSVLPDDRAKNLLSQVVLKEVYDVIRRKGKTEALRLVVLVDEAQHLAPRERGYISIPERFAIELRKYGFCLAVCATRPSLVSSNIIANSNTLISFMLNNQEDIDAVAGFLVGGARDAHVKETLRRLPVGEALVQLNHPQPREAARCRIGTGAQRRLLGLTLAPGGIGNSPAPRGA
jgi:DNA helicase HerA-like ATPase